MEIKYWVVNKQTNCNSELKISKNWEKFDICFTYHNHLKLNKELIKTILNIKNDLVLAFDSNEEKVKSQNIQV